VKGGGGGGGGGKTWSRPADTVSLNDNKYHEHKS